MTAVVIVIHLMLAIAMILVVLIQQSEGGGLGIGGSPGGGGMGGFMTGRATANLLTRATAIIAAAFMGTSLLLAILADQGRSSKTSIIDKPASEPTNQQPANSLPSLPSLPNVPSK